MVRRINTNTPAIIMTMIMILTTMYRLKKEKSGILGLQRIKVSISVSTLYNDTYPYPYSTKQLLTITGILQWNFEKFLIDPNGKVVNRWASTTTPAAIDTEIAKLLPEEDAKPSEPNPSATETSTAAPPEPAQTTAAQAQSMEHSAFIG